MPIFPGGLQRTDDDFSVRENLTKEVELLAHKLSVLQRQVSDNSAKTGDTENVDVMEKGISQRHVQSDNSKMETQNINGPKKTQDCEDVNGSTDSTSD